MAGILDWETRTVECPFCGEEVEILYCIDTDYNQSPATVSGIAGGAQKCPNCGEKITDDELEDY